MKLRNKYLRAGETTDEAFARACRAFLRGCANTIIPLGDGDPRKCKECRKAFLRAVVGIGKGPEVVRIKVKFESGVYVLPTKEETHDE